MRTGKPILAEPPSSRKAVPVNVLSREEQLHVLHLLVEGTSLRSVWRLTGVHRDTAARLMVRAGRLSRHFLDRRMRNLHLSFASHKQLAMRCRRAQRIGFSPDNWLDGRRGRVRGNRFLACTL